MRKRHRKKFKVNISRETFVLIAIVLIGLSLRLVKFKYSSLEADEGRDLLVARHIIHFGERVLLGHHAAGLGGYLGGYYGPYYYYFLAMLTFLFDHPYNIFFFITTWHSVSTIFVFYIGNYLISRRAGLISALLYSVSPIIIITNNVWGSYISFQIFILSFLFFGLYYKHKNRLYIYVHALLLILSISMEYSKVVCLPVFIIWLYYLNKSQEKLKLIQSIFLYSFVFLISFIPQIVYFGSRIRHFLNPKSYLYNLSPSYSRLYSMVSGFFSNLFITNTLLIILFTLCILVPWFIIHLIKNKKRITYNEVIIFATPVFGLIISSIKPDVYSHHLLYLYVFVFLELGLIIDKITQKNNPLAFLLLLPIMISILLPNNILSNFYKTNSLVETEIVATAIEDTINRYSLTDYSGNIDIVQNSNVDTPMFFPGPEFYLFLERNMDKQLISIVQETQFNYQQNKNAKYIFLICRTYVDNSSQFPLCFDNFYFNKKGIYVPIEQFYNSNNMKGYFFIKNDMSFSDQVRNKIQNCQLKT